MKTLARTGNHRTDRRSRGAAALKRVAASSLLLAACAVGVASAQDAPAPAPAPAPAKTGPVLPEPEDVERVTSDGLSVRGTFYPSTKGEKAVPVVLLHSWKGDGYKEFDDLAKFLQEQGHAVLVPDLRGHGRSTTFKGTGGQLDPARLGAGDVSDMVTKDMEAWRSFLIQKNNDRQLNVNSLCLVGSEMGASVAMHWALYDWNWLGFSGGQRKPSVKALVLLSPQRNFKGLDIRDPLANPVVRSEVSVMILVGKQDSKAYSQANQLYTILAKYHIQPPAGLDEKAQGLWDVENRDLFMRSLDTKLEGSKMLGVASLRVRDRIALFIDWRLVRKDFPWQEVGKKQ